MALLGQYQLSQMTVTDSSFSKEDLLPWDKPFAGTWRPWAGNLSNQMSILGVAPLVFGGVAWHNSSISGSEWGAQALMLYEVLALQSGVNLMVRSLQIWPRPFMLGSQGGSERSEGQASGSFYSGHSSAAFAIAVFTGVWFDQVYPHSKKSKWVWTSALLTAGTVASLRVVAGKHYPTDVLVGAAMGSLIGWAIPTLHKQSSSDSTPTNPNASGKNVAWIHWKNFDLSPHYFGYSCSF